MSCSTTATAAASLPKTTSAIQISSQGEDNKLVYRDDVPVAELKPGEILVKNTHAGVNFIDIYFRSGLYKPATGLPLTLGREGEGYIVAATPEAAKHGFSLGDRVAYIGWFTYATYTHVNYVHAIKLPSSLAPGLGAAAMIQGITALAMIRESYHAQKDDIILVHAAAGGVGALLVQLLSRVVGARVIATAGSAEKLALAKSLGAEWTVNYNDSQEGWVKRVGKLTGGEGVHAVYDGVGSATFDGDIEVIRRKGSLISYGNSSGTVEKFDILRLAPKNLTIVRPQVFGYIITREEFLLYAEELMKHVVSGTLNLTVHKEYKWEELDLAHEDLKGRRTTGKLLLKIGDA